MGTVRILLSSPLWRTAALSTLHEFIKHATNPSTANFSPLCVCVYMFVVCICFFQSHLYFHILLLKERQEIFCQTT